MYMNASYCVGTTGGGEGGVYWQHARLFIHMTTVIFCGDPLAIGRGIV